MPTKRTTLIDDRSGEIVYENTEYSSWQDTLVKDKGIHIFANGPYVRLFPKMKLDDMVLSSYGCLIQAMLHMDSDNSLPVKPKLAAQIGVSQPTIERHFRTWRACNAVKKDERRTYYINPLYGLHGKHLDVNLYRLFQNELDPILPSWIIERFSKM